MQCNETRFLHRLQDTLDDISKGLIQGMTKSEGEKIVLALNAAWVLNVDMMTGELLVHPICGVQLIISIVGLGILGEKYDSFDKTLAYKWIKILQGLGALIVDEIWHAS